MIFGAARAKKGGGKMKKIALLMAVVFGLSMLAGCTPGHWKKATGAHDASGHSKH